MSPVFGRVSSVVFLRTVKFTARLNYRKLASSLISEVMKLYSNRGNPSLLRILAAKKLADVSMTIQYITNGGTSYFLSASLKMKLEPL